MFAVALVAMAVPLVPFLLPPSPEGSGSWLAFTGRFHPFVVHAPVTLIPLAWFLDIIAVRRAQLLPAVSLVLFIAAISALTAFTLGVLLMLGEGTTGGLVMRHYRAASGVVSATLLAAMLRFMAQQTSSTHHVRQKLALALSRVGLTVAVLITAWTGHLGGQLTHGENYLTEHAPWIQEQEPELATRSADTSIYAAMVAPILREHCVTCHGAGKIKGDLRLDTFAALRQGGKHGPVVREGEPENSEIIRRITLPPGHDEAMPAQGRPPLSRAEIAILQWWIAAGASDQLSVTDAALAKNAPEAVRQALQAAMEVLPIEKIKRLAEVTGLSIVPVSNQAADGLRVTAFGRTRPGVDAAVGQLAPIAGYVREADLSHSDATDAALAMLATWTKLRTLNLAFTRVTGGELDKLRVLTELEALNLAGTPIDPASAAHMTTLGTLKRLIVTGTPLDPEDVGRIASALPECSVIAGAQLAKP